MTELPKIAEWRTRTGMPVDVSGLRVVPESQALSFRLPFFHFVWNRPVAIIVERNGQAKRIPIVDVTRVAEIAIAVSLTVFALLVGVLHRRKEMRDGC